MSDGPKFACPECGKVYPWKAELAGKKGKCKCGAIMHVPTSSEGVAARVASKKHGSKGGSSVMNTSSHVASRPRPTPKPVPVDEPIEEPQEAYKGNGEAVEEDVVAPPPYSADAVATAPAPAAGGTKFAPAAASDTSGKPPLRWAPALKWLGIGVALTAWSVFEFFSPEDLTVRKRGLRIIVALANQVIPHGGAILLGLLAAFFIVMGVLILLGKAKDSDYEQKQKQNAWPGARGRK